MNKRVVVIGGGITGLTALRQIRQRSPGTEAILLEAAPRLGGKILTSDFLGRPIDEGADAFITRVPWAIDLCKELGLNAAMTSPATSSAFVLINSELRKLPAGLVLGVPTKFFPLVKSRIVSPLAALRAGFDRFLPDDWPGDDESVGGLIRRRMGDQIAERLVDPLIGSINAGDTDHLDAALTAPQLETAARRNRSLILGLREQSKLGSRTATPVFMGLENGMSHLTETLVSSLAGSDIRTGIPAKSVEVDGDKLKVVTDGVSFDSEAVVVATPAHQTARLLAS